MNVVLAQNERAMGGYVKLVPRGRTNAGAMRRAAGQNVGKWREGETNVMNQNGWP